MTARSGHVIQSKYEDKRVKGKVVPVLN